MVTLFFLFFPPNWKRTFKWCDMARLWLGLGHLKDTCHNDIGLCAQNIKPRPRFNGVVTILVWPLQDQDNLHLDLSQTFVTQLQFRKSKWQPFSNHNHSTNETISIHPNNQNCKVGGGVLMSVTYLNLTPYQMACDKAWLQELTLKKTRIWKRFDHVLRIWQPF